MQLIFSILLVFLVLAGDAFPEEQRCTELGANCICSEPLNTTSYVHNSVYTNPGDSTSKECGSAQAGGFINGDSDPATKLTIEAPSSMPSGATVSNIWSWGPTNNTVNQAEGVISAVTSSTRRLCIRKYFQFTSDFCLWANCNNKIMRFDYQVGGNQKGQVECSTSFGHIGCAQNGWDISFLNPEEIPITGDSIGISQCKTTWCQMELCLGGNISTGQGITAALHVSTTNGLKSNVIGPLYLGNSQSGSSINRILIYDLYRELGPTGSTVTGSRKMSHAMQAQWNQDNGQWIGAAYEIEGSGGTPTPTPTATASPTTPPTGQGNPKADYLNFDGSNDRVIIPHNFRGPLSELETITDAITIEAWIRPETLSATTQQNRIVSRSSILELTTSTGDTGCGFGTSGDVQWRASIQGVNDRICGGSLSLNTWAHVAGVYTGSAFTLYINGTQVASAARSGTLDFNVSQLTMGNHPTSARPFDGDIDEVRIWNIARTQGQIAASMNSQLNGTESGLVAEYRLDDCVGQVVTNSTVNNLNGYLGAFNTSDSDDPTWVPGGCATPTPTSTPTATNTPTNSPTNTPTNTPTSTPTATPTIAPGSTPTATPTAAPGDGSGVLSYKPGSPAVVIIGGN